MEPWKEDAERAWILLCYEGQMQWFAKKNSRTFGGRITSLDQLFGTIRNAEALSWDLYLNVNPTKPKSGKIKLSRDDVTHWNYIVCDIDPVSFCPTMNRVSTEPSPGSIHEALNDFGGHILFSGRGYQVWKSVLPVVKIASSALAQNIEQCVSMYLRTVGLGARLGDGWKVDTSCSDLPRVVRCPGSFNQKTGKRATFIKIDSKFSINPEVFLNHWMQLLPTRGAEPVNQNFTSLAAVLPHLTVTARKFILYGYEQGGRHKAMIATLRNLRELGVTEEVARGFVYSGAKACSPKLENIECLRAIRDCYGKVH